MPRRRPPTFPPLPLSMASFALILMASGCDRGRAQPEATPVTSPSDDAHQHLERMAQEHAGDTPDATPAATEAPRQPVTSETVPYATVGGQPVTGYLSRPTAAEGPLPALVVVHEWWGLNDNIRGMTDRLAGEGYEALAVDLYGGQHADTPERARELVDAVLADTASAQDNVRQAVAFVRQRNPGRPIGSIGWCFGGGWALQAALLVPDEVSAAVVYYGRLVTDPTELAPLRAAVLGHFGSADPSIPVETVHAFESAMQGLGKEVEVHIYEGAHHAFANPSGQNYQPEAAAQAWERTVAFLGQHLR